MTEEAQEARRKYQRVWNAANKERRAEYMRQYWERKAQKERENDGTGEQDKNC